MSELLVVLTFLAFATSRYQVLAFPAVAVLPSSPTQSHLGVSSGNVATQRLEALLDAFPGTERCCRVGATRLGRGLVATQDLQPGQVALRIPLECVLSESDPGRNEDEWTGRLAKRLMECISPSSSSTDFFKNVIMKAYMESLPEPPSTPARGDWPKEKIEEFDDDLFIKQIHAEKDWRYKQWENFCGTDDERRMLYFDALDFTCSRTIRLGDHVMLVPLLDMANHASQDEGGGYFERQKDSICLRVGERGVRQGQEVTMDYGSRSNEDWLLHYGFLPQRNLVESVTLPQSKRLVTWKDVRTSDFSLKKECQMYLENAATTLEADVELLRVCDKDDFHLQMALQYRINRKSLLSAVSGKSQRSSFFLTFSGSNPSYEDPSVLEESTIVSSEE